MVFCLDSEPVVPCERITGNETTENIVGADQADSTENEKGQTDSISQEIVVVNQVSLFSPFQSDPGDTVILRQLSILLRH